MRLRLSKFTKKGGSSLVWIVEPRRVDHQHRVGAHRLIVGEAPVGISP